jgi:hypothetical protein
MFQWLRRQYAKRVVNINVNITVASLAAIVGTVVVVHFSRYLGVEDSDKTLIMVITFVADWLIDLFVAVTLHWLANHWPRRWRRSQGLIEKYEQVIDAAPPPSLAMIKDAAVGVLNPQLPHLSDIPHFLQHGPQRSDQAAGETPTPATSTPATPARESAPAHAPVPAKPEISFLRDATTIQLQRLCLSPLFYVIVAVGQWFLLHAGIERELTVIVPFFAAIVITRVIHTYWMIHADPIVLEEWEQSKRRREAHKALREARLAGVNGSPTPSGAPPALVTPLNGDAHSTDGTASVPTEPAPHARPNDSRSLSRSE